MSLLRRTPTEPAALRRAKARLARLDLYPRKVDSRYLRRLHVPNNPHEAEARAAEEAA